MAKVRVRTGGYTKTIYREGKSETASRMLRKKNRYQKVVLGEEMGMTTSNIGLLVILISGIGCASIAGILTSWEGFMGGFGCCFGLILPYIPVMYFHFRHEMCVEQRVYVPTYSEGETNRRGWWKW